MNKINFALAFFLLLNANIKSQDIKKTSVTDTLITSASDDSEISDETSQTFFNKKNISIITLSTGLAASLIGSYYVWWKDDHKKFNFYSGHWLNDPGLNGIDKIGHFYTSYLFYRLQKELLLWGEYSEEFSSITSGVLTLVLALSIEVGDGFSEYGFDFQDLTFNIAGLGYGILQDKFPALNNFKFKWSYIPKNHFKFPPKFSENYDGHIYWLTVNIHNLFESSIGKIWPEFIQPAFGFSVEDKGNRREFIVGLDFNLLSLFNTKDPNWNLIGKSIDLFHVPAPGVKYSSVKPVYRLFLLN